MTFQWINNYITIFGFSREQSSDPKQMRDMHDDDGQSAYML